MSDCRCDELPPPYLAYRPKIDRMTTPLLGARHAAEIADEAVEASVAEQVELDVRGIERRKALATLAEECADRGERTRAAQVADDRNHEVALLQRS